MSMIPVSMVKPGMRFTYEFRGTTRLYMKLNDRDPSKAYAVSVDGSKLIFDDRMIYVKLIDG